MPVQDETSFVRRGRERVANTVICDTAIPYRINQNHHPVQRTYNNNISITHSHCQHPPTPPSQVLTNPAPHQSAYPASQRPRLLPPVSGTQCARRTLASDSESLSLAHSHCHRPTRSDDNSAPRSIQTRKPGQCERREMKNKTTKRRRTKTKCSTSWSRSRDL